MHTWLTSPSSLAYLVLTQPVDRLALMTGLDGTIATIAEHAMLDAIEATATGTHAWFAATVNMLMIAEPAIARMYHAEYMSHTIALRCQSENTKV